MRYRALTTALLTTALFLTGCRKNPEPPKPTPEPTPQPEQVTPNQPNPLSPALRELAGKYGDEVEARRRRTIPHRLPDPVPVAIFHLRSSMSDAQMADFASELAKVNDRVIVNCFLTKVTVDGAAKLKTVSNVAGIWFRGADARLLTLLEGMTQLEELTFGNDNATDAALAPLAKLSSLKVLEVSGDKLTPAAFAHLAGLKELRRFKFDTSALLRTARLKPLQQQWNPSVEDEGNQQLRLVPQRDEGVHNVPS